VRKPADTVHTHVLAVVPQPQLSSHKTVVDKQCKYETFIVPEINNNNIAVFMRRPGCRRTLRRRMGALFRKREAPAPISSPATAVI